MLYVRGTIKERLWKLGIAVSLLPLSYAPSLLVARTLSSLTSVIVVYAFFSFRGYAQTFASSLSPVYTGCGRCRRRLWTIGHVSGRCEIMRSQLVQGNLAQMHGLYVIRSTWRRRSCGMMNLGSSEALDIHQHGAVLLRDKLPNMRISRRPSRPTVTSRSCRGYEKAQLPRNVTTRVHAPQTPPPNNLTRRWYDDGL